MPCFSDGIGRGTRSLAFAAWVGGIAVERVDAHGEPHRDRTVATSLRQQRPAWRNSSTLSLLGLRVGSDRSRPRRSRAAGGDRRRARSARRCCWGAAARAVRHRGLCRGRVSTPHHERSDTGRERRETSGRVRANASTSRGFKPTVADGTWSIPRDNSLRAFVGLYRRRLPSRPLGYGPGQGG